MATSKAGYKGDETGEMLSDFSEMLKAEIMELYRLENAHKELSPIDAETFVAEILNEAWWVKSELAAISRSSTKPELRAEQADLLKKLKGMEGKLRRLSPDLDRLLGVDADPLGCADRIKALMSKVDAAQMKIDSLPAVKREVEMKSHIACEMAVRVLRVLESHGIKASATSTSDFDNSSTAVKILAAIGQDVGLDRSDLTWRDIIIQSRKAPEA